MGIKYGAFLINSSQIAPLEGANPALSCLDYDLHQIYIANLFQMITKSGFSTVGRKIGAIIDVSWVPSRIYFQQSGIEFPCEGYKVT